jgi:hypothetical protein
MVYEDGLRGDYRLLELEAPAVGMVMDDKEKCAALYKAFAGEHTEPSRWNEIAGNLLAEMADEIKKCTKGMGWVLTVLPSTSIITWLWVVKISYHV